MKIGVVGTGTMGKNHARVYSELKGVEDVYVFDVNGNNTAAMGKMGLIVCDSMKELFDCVDATSICVPTKYHLDVARIAIENNVHFLIEKPMTSTVEEGEELSNSLQNKDLIVGVGHIERFNPIVNEISRMLVNPSLVEMRRLNPLSSRITDSSVVEDLMIHDIDIIFNVFFNTKNYKINSSGNSDMCVAMATFDKSTVSISASRKSCKKIRSIYVEDENFTIEGDFMTQEIYTYWRPETYGIERAKYTQENIIEKIIVNKVEPLKLELGTFVDCVIKRAEFPVTIEQSLSNIKICEEIKAGL